MTDNELGRKKFLGSLLGVALGDAVGALWEGYRMATEQEFGRIARISNALRYTDDTHMTIGVVESLMECHGFDGKHMTERFIDNYSKEPWRGYGLGLPRIFGLIKSGMAWDEAGGDTDTIASMARAISGAYLGIDGLPSQWLEYLENKNYISHLASRLCRITLTQA